MRMMQLAGTPEDGGQHASTWPWVVWWAKASYHLAPHCWDAYSGTANMRQLTARIEPKLYNLLPNHIRECYSPVYLDNEQYEGEALHNDHGIGSGGGNPVAYWLRLERAPPDERDRWRTLTSEQNYHEWMGLMEYRELYEWSKAQGKFMLRKERQGWLAK
jgi:hypothetical protein